MILVLMGLTYLGFYIISNLSCDDEPADGMEEDTNLLKPAFSIFVNLFTKIVGFFKNLFTR